MPEENTQGAASARWRGWLRQWEKLSARERNLRTAGAAIALIVVYALLLWPLADKRIGKLLYDQEKMAMREKNSVQKNAAPVAPLPKLGGRSPSAAQAELSELARQLETVRQELQVLNARFVPLDDSLAMNALKSGLTSLAEAGDMEVTAIEHLYSRHEDKERVPTQQLIQEAAAHNPFKRPLMVMKARASFRGLMQFLDGLADLPYVAAPVGCDIAVEVERHPESQAIVRQWLQINIKFAI